IAAAALVPGFFSLQALAQDMFSDVPADHWAQPFITTLAQQGILEGYPDGTFRPEAAIDRDEYAAVIRQAFATNPERDLASASTLGDVPEGYWAAPAIEEAYEMGFMDLPATNQFNPQAEVSRAEAMAALVQGLELTGPSPMAIPIAAEAQPEIIQSQGGQPRRGTPFHLAVPMASTELMKAFAPPGPGGPGFSTYRGPFGCDPEPGRERASVC
ncbi:MAG: S-layer homology domain-containing protein, partial [Leptolyngbyaceae cyanobacterium SM2_3_12]|nr:S-layer homology domain-containing protein [Leptolyngbyaceae cyanobacterium SM2_3_12]